MTRSQERIEAWASENDFALQSVVPKPLAEGNPWSLWDTGRGTRFFQVTIIDTSSCIRSSKGDTEWCYRPNTERS